MQRRKSRVKIFRSDRAREWATDFMIGIGMFVLVAFFASTHTNSALPAPLAKTQAALEQKTTLIAKNKEPHISSTVTVSSKNTTSGRLPIISKTSSNNSIMVFMALVFSALLTLTIQFWRNLRRAYASPQRKWGEG